MSLSAMPPWLAAYVLFLAGLMGACGASALSCLAVRLCRKESWLRGRSRCDACGHELKARDLIPIVSYLALRGRCRYCKEKIGALSFAGEVLLAGVFAALVVRYGISLKLLKALVLVVVLYPAALCDLETFQIPDRFAVAGAVGWLLLLPFAENWRQTLSQGLWGSLGVAGLIGVVSWMVSRGWKKDVMGGGDLKLYALTGLYLGPWLNLLNVMVSCVVGLLFHNAFAARAAKDEELPEGAFPFGPAIALSTLFCMLATWG